MKFRFAPSPTGMLHIGNARTALITWLASKKMGGHFLLRIDDTDAQRSKPEFEDAIEQSLEWMGLSWDDKARQSGREARYKECIEKLKQEERLYPCYETPEELALKRKTQLSRGKPPIYDRESLTLSAEDKAQYDKQGRKPHWRFKLLHEEIEWNDLVRSNIKFDGADLSDPVVIREDGSPLYHLCSVIDDIDYDITHVTRGEDHVSNTATHIQMFEALGSKAPLFAHLPLIADIEGGKLSKRLGAMSVFDIRDDEGLEAMALVSLLAALGTSDAIEPYNSLDPLIEKFDFAKFSRNAPKFDPDEILRLNTKLLHETAFTNIACRIESLGISGMQEDFWTVVRANIERLRDTKEWWDVANGPVSPVISEPDFIDQAAQLLPEPPWSEQTWASWTKKIKEETGRKGKDLFMPLRQALTGMDHGPELANLLLLIGPDKARDRLESHKKAA